MAVSAMAREETIMQYLENKGESVELESIKRQGQSDKRIKKIDKIAEDAFVEMLVAIIKRLKNR
jgi:hypothetical protein